MTIRSNKVAPAEIVDMVGLRQSVGRRQTTPLGRSNTEFNSTATLLSMRQSLVHRATIGLKDIDAVREEFSGQAVEEIMCALRHLLHLEFGSLRVHRYRQALSVGHHNAEALIAGMLRVQYHSRQFELPAFGIGSRSRGRTAPAVTWGVGDSISEAELQRLRNRQASRS